MNWWQAESNALDSVGDKDGTLINGTGFEPGVVGQAFAFDGVDDSVSFGNSVGNFGTNDFTVECWVQTTNTTRVQSLLSKRAVCRLTSHFETRLGAGLIGIDGLVVASMATDAQGLDYNIVRSSTPVNDGLFHHVAIVRETTNMLVYVDGVLEDSNSTSGITIISNATEFVAGRSPCVTSDGTRYFDGRLDELSLYDRALSQGEIAAIHAAGEAGKCPPKPPCELPQGIVSWWQAEGDTSDAIGPNSGTLIGDVSYAPGKVGQAFSLDGSGDFVTFGNEVGNFGTNDFSIELWLRTSDSSTIQSLLSKRSRCGFASFFDVSIGDGNARKYGVVFVALTQNASGANRNVVVSTTRVDDGDFHHVAVVREGPAAFVYVDGILEDSNSSSGITLISNSADFSAGSSPCVGTSGRRHFNGDVDELSVYSRALAPEEIEAIYYAGSAGKCRPPCIAPMISEQPLDRSAEEGGRRWFQRDGQRHS